MAPVVYAIDVKQLITQIMHYKEWRESYPKVLHHSYLSLEYKISDAVGDLFKQVSSNVLRRHDVNYAPCLKNSS